MAFFLLSRKYVGPVRSIDFNLTAWLVVPFIAPEKFVAHYGSTLRLGQIGRGFPHLCQRAGSAAVVLARLCADF